MALDMLTFDLFLSADLGPPFRRLLSLVHQPGMRIGHTVRVRGTVISSSYWAHKGFHRIRASDICECQITKAHFISRMLSVLLR